MFTEFIFFTFFLPFCLSSASGICYKQNLCRNKSEPCHPVVLQCQNGSCRYRRFSSNDNQRSIFTRWSYDSTHQRCRRYDNRTENQFVHFRFRRDCRRLCPIIRQKQSDKIITLRVSDRIDNYNDTIHVHLYIDLSPNWIHHLSNRMNVSTRSYNVQTHYFRNYRRHFPTFIDPVHRLMSNDQGKNEKRDDQ